MRKNRMWKVVTVFSCRSGNDLRYVRSAERQRGEKKTLKVAMECGYAPYNWTTAG